MTSSDSFDLSDKQRASKSARKLERTLLQSIIIVISFLFTFTSIPNGGSHQWTLTSLLFGPILFFTYLILYRQTRDYVNFTLLRLVHDGEARREFPMFCRAVCRDIQEEIQWKFRKNNVTNSSLSLSGSEGDDGFCYSPLG